MQASTYYTDFQALLLQLATEFINLPSSEFDQQMYQVLALVGQYVEVDHCYIALFSDRDYMHAHVVHEWNAPQVEPISSQWSGDMSRWFVDQLKAFKVVPVSRIEDLPPEAATYGEVLQFYGVKSCLDVPLIKDKRLFGLVGYEKSQDYCEWPPETIALLKVVGEIYVNAYERKQTEAALVDKERLQAALQKEKESSGQRANLISIISHEFRAPMSIIKMSAQMAGRQVAEKSKVNDYLERIDHQITRLDRLLTEIMMAIQSERGYLRFHPDEVDLEQLCQMLLDEVQATMGLNHHLQFIAHGRYDRFSGDADLLKYILTNLLENAVKYSPAGSSILLELYPAANEVMIQVRDEGIGIPDDDRAQLFAAYFRASNVGPVRGSGLGLKIVKDCVDLHGGRILIESTPGQGSVFQIFLPVDVRDATGLQHEIDSLR